MAMSLARSCPTLACLILRADTSLVEPVLIMSPEAGIQSTGVVTALPRQECDTAQLLRMLHTCDVNISPLQTHS